MKRNGTGILATGAILGGTAIGVGATLALLGNPLDRAAGEEIECLVEEANAGWSGRWTVATGDHGHGYVTRRPGGGWHYRFEYHPGHKSAEWKTAMSFEKAGKKAGKKDGKKKDGKKK